jgi:hypothetical protein
VSPHQGACVDTQSSKELALLNTVSNASPGTPIPLFETLSLDYQEGRKLFCQRYGSGLRFLISRKCSGTQSDMCFEAIIEASLAAISADEVTDDAEIPSLVRNFFHQMTAGFSEVSIARVLQANREQMKFDQRTIDLIGQRLTLFGATQRAALYRFYVKQENAATICHDLNLLPDEFEFLRNVLRSVVKLEMDFAILRKPVQSLSACARGVAI